MCNGGMQHAVFVAGAINRNVSVQLSANVHALANDALTKMTIGQCQHQSNCTWESNLLPGDEESLDFEKT